MTHLIVEGPFDMDRLASQFPGLLRFSRNPAESDAETEIIGDVPETVLIAAINALTPITVATPVDPPPPPVVVSAPLARTNGHTHTASAIIAIVTLSVILSFIFLSILHVIGAI